MPFLDYTGLTTFWNKVKGILAGKQNSLTAGEGVSLENDTVSLQEPIKEITQAQYDALTEEQRNAGLYVVTDAHINLNDHGDIYSTEETRIGTWINGKPVYQLVIPISVYLGVDKEVDISISPAYPDIDEPICVSGYIRNMTSGRGYLINSSFMSVSYFSTRHVFTLTGKGNSASNMSGYAIVQYTKTTDPTPTVPSVSTQSLSVNSLSSDSQSSEKVATSQVPLPSYVTYAPASASASSVHFAFAPASASSTKLKL